MTVRRVMIGGVLSVRTRRYLIKGALLPVTRSRAASVANTLNSESGAAYSTEAGTPLLTES